MAQYKPPNQTQWRIIWHPAAYKEFTKLKQPVRQEIRAVIHTLEQLGRLTLPDGKKLEGYDNCFEARLRKNGQHRLLYAYNATAGVIVCLTVFNKKSQKTPPRYVQRAQKRMRKMYEN